MTIIYDKSGNFLVASLDGEEVTYKPPTYESALMEDLERSLRIVLSYPCGPNSTLGNITLVSGHSGETGLMTPLLSPSLYTKIQRMN
jgi:hypothetical protein